MSATRTDGIQKIREACNEAAAAVTRIHPHVPALADKPTQDEVYKALFALTKEVEVVKKQLLKLERRDESAEL